MHILISRLARSNANFGYRGLILDNVYKPNPVKFFLPTQIISGVEDEFSALLLFRIFPVQRQYLDILSYICRGLSQLKIFVWLIDIN